MVGVDVNEDFSARIIAALERGLSDALFGTATNANAEEPSLLTAASLSAQMREWSKLIRNFRRSDVTVIVDRGHEGPMIGHETPHDGWVYEMAPRDAQRLHEHWPFVLKKILNEDSAEYHPASFMDRFVPKYLPMPPFIVEPSDDPKTPPPAPMTETSGGLKSMGVGERSGKDISRAT